MERQFDIDKKHINQIEAVQDSLKLKTQNLERFIDKYIPIKI